jgi:hypothetical protein
MKAQTEAIRIFEDLRKLNALQSRTLSRFTYVWNDQLNRGD